MEGGAGLHKQFAPVMGEAPIMSRSSLSGAMGPMPVVRLAACAAPPPPPQNTCTPILIRSPDASCPAPLHQRHGSPLSYALA